MPEIRVAAMVFDRQNPDGSARCPVVDGKGKAGQQESAHVLFKNPPSFWRLDDAGYGILNDIKELTAQRGDLLLVKLRRLNELCLRSGVVNYAHPMARRAASMTLWWERAGMWPAEISSSRRMASERAEEASASLMPASKLCQSSCASRNRSAKGRVAAS
ncbi:MAG: hypothetical protein WC765_03035 [Phycisphaerae bacterium]